ncbi:hypothetical protein MNBD_GAMMA08-2054 [hydrothermal vent metagenome]|uniref:Uncharacterized protein n=1 Tax=hydrothermal vent metagenome TaxID=652676 RepID=A0A3B0XVL5_9ZZZZ
MFQSWASFPVDLLARLYGQHFSGNFMLNRVSRYNKYFALLIKIILFSSLREKSPYAQRIKTISEKYKNVELLLRQGGINILLTHALMLLHPRQLV